MDCYSQAEGRGIVPRLSLNTQLVVYQYYTGVYHPH